MSASEENSKCRVINLVVDSAGFLKNAPLEDLGENIYTEEGVVNEIRDKATKERLQVLPYELHFKRPTAEEIKFVTEFSKKTGDYCSLSAVDLRVIALTYHLEKEVVGDDNIRPEPFKQELSFGGNYQLPLGFYMGKKKSNHDKNSENYKDAESKFGDQIEDQIKEDVTLGIETKIDIDLVIESEEDESCLKSDDDNEDDEANFDDDDGWVTINNIKNAKDDSKPTDQSQPMPVACLTTDYAIQNVLIQMGLKVVSIDGMLIQRVKMYLLRCSACFKTTKDMTKRFCPQCGNTTLRKTSYSVNEDGTVTYYMSKKPPSKRGLRYSLPTPRGGKYSNDPILCEDQRVPQQRTTKQSRATLDPLDIDYIAGDTPFAMKDINSRSFKHGFNKRRPNEGIWRNPNENKKYGKRR